MNILKILKLLGKIKAYILYGRREPEACEWFPWQEGPRVFAKALDRTHGPLIYPLKRGVGSTREDALKKAVWIGDYKCDWFSLRRKVENPVSCSPYKH
jgi:hypothetical protein